MFFFNNSIFKNFTSLSFRTFIFTIQQLIYVPLFLHFWNIDIYSEWLIISTIPVILSYTELGIGSYAANLVVIAYNKKAKEKINSIFQNSTNFIFCFFILGAFLFILINYFFDIYNFLRIESIDSFDFYLVIIFLIFKFSFNVQLSLNLSLLKAVHKFHYLSYFQSIFICTEVFLIILVLLNGGDIYSVALISLINYFFAAILSYFYIKKKFIWFNYRLRRISFIYLKEIIYPSVSFMMPGLCKAITIQGTIILISSTTTPSIVILYNSLRIILNGVRQVVAVVSNAFYPEFTIYFAKKNWSQLKKKLFLLIKISTLITFILSLLILFFVKIPFDIWTKNSIEWDSVFFFIFLFATLIDWLNVPIHSFPYSINKHTLLNKIHLLSLFFYFLIVMILFDNLKIYSVPISLLISNLFFLMWNLLILKNLLKGK